jgi:hypothetical protein
MMIILRSSSKYLCIFRVTSNVKSTQKTTPKLQNQLDEIKRRLLLSNNAKHQQQRILDLQPWNIRDVTLTTEEQKLISFRCSS